jgi:hypothetical protein
MEQQKVPGFTATLHIIEWLHVTHWRIGTYRTVLWACGILHGWTKTYFPHLDLLFLNTQAIYQIIISQSSNTWWLLIRQDDESERKKIRHRIKHLAPNHLYSGGLPNLLSSWTWLWVSLRWSPADSVKNMGLMCSRWRFYKTHVQ